MADFSPSMIVLPFMALLLYFLCACMKAPPAGPETFHRQAQTPLDKYQYHSTTHPHTGAPVASKHLLPKGPSHHYFKNKISYFDDDIPHNLKLGHEQPMFARALNANYGTFESENPLSNELIDDPKFATPYETMVELYRKKPPGVKELQQFQKRQQKFNEEYRKEQRALELAVAAAGSYHNLMEGYHVDREHTRLRTKRPLYLIDNGSAVDLMPDGRTTTHIYDHTHPTNTEAQGQHFHPPSMQNIDPRSQTQFN